MGRRGLPSLSLRERERALSESPGPRGLVPSLAARRESKGEDGLGPSFLIPLPCPSPARNGGGEKFRGEEARGPPPGSPSPAGKREKERPDQTADELPPSCRPAAGSERGLAPGPGAEGRRIGPVGPGFGNPSTPGTATRLCGGAAPAVPRGMRAKNPKGRAKPKRRPGAFQP